MSHLYHLVPRNFAGDTLYPLNVLRKKLPAVYEAHARKYEGREALLQRRIPILDCLWNDVLHFSPVHPRAIRDAYNAAGGTWKPRRWFEVAPLSCGFDARNTVVYEYPLRERGDFTLRADDFSPFNHELLDEMTTLPEGTAAHYAEALAAGRPVFVFHLIPHVLHRGSIERDRVAVIEV